MSIFGNSNSVTDSTISQESKIPQTGGENTMHVIIKYGIILISLIIIGMMIKDLKKK